MNKKDLLNLNIPKINRDLEQKILDNWDHIAKPLNGLGYFEKITARIGAILGDETIDIGKRIVVMMCADNGIIEEGISQSGSEVTASVARLMGLGQSSVCKMAQRVGIDTCPVDIGIKDADELPGVINCKISHGTKNFVKEPAMSEKQCLDAIEVGINLVKSLKAKGVKIIATGEMGIGNTTTSASVTAALLHMSGKDIAGRGAGLSDEGLLKKISVIDQAIEKYDLYNTDALTTLMTVGGLDIAGLCGVFIGGAMFGVPIVVDGFISATAALVAQYICPGVSEYCIPSHRGAEKGIVLILNKLGLNPIINGDLALGEGTGAVMVFPLLDMVLSLYEGGTRFNDTDIKQYERFT